MALSILRAGQSDGLRWWDDESLTDAGRLSLKRLFPHDHERIAVRLALEAALARQRGVLQNAGVTDAVTLMDLAADTLRSRIINCRVPKKPIGSIDELRSMLQQTIPGLEFAIPRKGNAGAILDLSEVIARGQDALAPTLAAGYLAGEVGHLVVPFVRLEGE